MFSVDGDSRPTKRQKIEKKPLKALPDDILLLSLPHLLVHPPTHRHHTRSNFLSIFALKSYLALPNHEANLEFRAWTELAEAGLRMGLHLPGIEDEVEKAITKALIIAQKHPSLRIYKPQIAQLSARLALHQGNQKLAQNTLKKVLTCFIAPSDPPYVKYAAHLAYINSLSIVGETDGPSVPISPYASVKALGAIRELNELATRNNHHEVSLFSIVLELRELVQHGAWNKACESLERAEKVFTLSFDPISPNNPGTTNIEKVLIMHVLVIGVVYYTYLGDNANSLCRLKKLHDMLDGGSLLAFGASGIVEITLPNSLPLRVQVTHPRVFFTLGFLVSSVSKRDPVGRKPKRKLFANEGILVADKELKKDIPLPIWASIADAKSFQRRILKVKFDLMCEIIGVCISRSEFDEAERNLSQLIADTRTHALFESYSARISLHHAHLAHSLNQSERALKCYLVAAHLSRRRPFTKRQAAEEDDGVEDYWTNVSARVGELWLLFGVASELADEEGREREMEALRKAGAGLLKECEGLGGTLRAAGTILAACLSQEFLVTKTHLRTALNLTTTAQDNHLRALVLALVADQYVHTSTEHAEVMLGTAEQLAAGLGAQPKSAASKTTAPDVKVNYDGISTPTPKTPAAGGGDGLGNVHLRLWIGERSLELKKRSTDEKAASKQTILNEKLRGAVTMAQKRKFCEVG